MLVSLFLLFLLGEDIGMSDDGDDESCESQDNELEYDDMFLRDNDLGSDAGSDGEVMARVAMRVREGEERIGCRFIQSRLKPEGSTSPAAASGDTAGLTVTTFSTSTSTTNETQTVSYIFDTQIQSSLKFTDGHFSSSVNAASVARLGQCAAAAYDNDSMRLSSYTAVVYSQALSHMPYLGTVTSAKADSKLPVMNNKEKKQTQGQTIISTIKNQPTSSSSSAIKHADTAITTTATTIKHADTAIATTATTTTVTDAASEGCGHTNNDDSDDTIKESTVAVGMKVHDNQPESSSSSSSSSTEVSSQSQSQQSLEKSILLPLTEFIHGKKDNLEKLVTDFTTAHNHIYSKALTRRMISDIADKVRHSAAGSGSGSPRWIARGDRHSAYCR